MKNEEQKEFDELKAEYSSSKTTDSHRKELILLMQDNLRQRCGNESRTVKCLDGNIYSIDSDNVSELYAIDAALNDAVRSKKFDEISEIKRDDALSKNKNSPSNPYPEE